MDWMSWIVPDVLREGVSPGLYMVIAASACLLIGVAKGGFGGGIAALATPLLLIALPGHVTLSMILPWLIVCDIFTWRNFPGEWHARSYWTLAGGTFIGLGFGLAALLYFVREDVDGDRWIKIAVGTVSLAFSVLETRRHLRKKKVSHFKPGFRIGTLTGVLCGFTTVVTHAAGVFLNIYLLTQRLDRRVFVGTCARYYLTFNLIKIPVYLLAGVLAQQSYITFETLKWNLWLFPLCPVGVAFGAWLNRRISPQGFNLVICLFLAIAGIKLISGALP